MTIADGKAICYKYYAKNTRTVMETEGRREEYVTDTESTYSQVLEVKVFEKESIKEDIALSAGAGEVDPTGTVHTENAATAYPEGTVDSTDGPVYTASYVYGLGLVGEEGKNG